MITLPCQPGWTPLGWGYFGHKVDKMSYSYDFAPGKLVAFDGSHVRDSSGFGSITEHRSLLSFTSNIGSLFLSSWTYISLVAPLSSNLFGSSVLLPDSHMGPQLDASMFFADFPEA